MKPFHAVLLHCALLLFLPFIGVLAASLNLWALGLGMWVLWLAVVHDVVEMLRPPPRD